MIELITDLLNAELGPETDIRVALEMIRGCAVFSRETRSAALGETSEHLVARITNGKREDCGNRGFDLRDGNGRKIEVKSRLRGEWGDGLMFDFHQHTRQAYFAYCIAWDDQKNEPLVFEAYRMPVSFLLERWPSQHRYCARTTLGKMRAAWQENSN
jgi:hypothetical protein